MRIICCYVSIHMYMLRMVPYKETGMELDGRDGDQDVFTDACVSQPQFGSTRRLFIFYSLFYSILSCIMAFHLLLTSYKRTSVPVIRRIVPAHASSHSSQKKYRSMKGTHSSCTMAACTTWNKELCTPAALSSRPSFSHLTSAAHIPSMYSTTAVSFTMFPVKF